MATPWFALQDPKEVPSPSLLVYPDRVGQNLRQMLAIIGDPTRLRPHIKTHKMPQLVQWQIELGISKFKCATIAEAEMAAQAGAPDLLLAYQPVGPNIARLIQLIERFPQTRFSTIADDATTIDVLSQACSREALELELLLDIDCGMHRSGIPPGPDALSLYRRIAASPGLLPAGLHIYDGHRHEADPDARRRLCDECFSPARALRDQLLIEGLPVPKLVVGGSPTFPFHARREPFVECGPGTTVFWDAGYSRFTDLPFVPAAALLTRVISRPGPHRLCLDLGHKSVASEMPHPRAQFPDLPDAQPVSHSEEHLVIDSAHAATLHVGDPLYAIPWHICPTVALHAHALVVEKGTVTGRWDVTARNRTLSV